MRRERSDDRWAPLVAAAAVLAVGALTWRYLVDDAFIISRYAANLAAGHGWSMNPGVPSDGVTAPLWLLPVTGAHALGLDAPSAQRLLGLLATAAAVLLTVRDQVRGRWLVALMLAAQATLGIWGGAGLETGVATLALTLAARPAWGAAGWRLAAVGAAAVPWLRPELIGVVAALAFALEGRERRAVLSALGGGLALVVAFRLALFGHPLPLASAAKLGGLGDGLRYLVTGAVLVTGLGGLGLVVRAARAEAVLAGALSIHAVSIVIAGGDWMPGHRLLVPALPLYAVAVTRGMLLSRHRARWAALGLALLVPAGVGVAQIHLAWTAGQQRLSRGPVIAAALEGRGPVALVDAGYLAWKSGEEVVDLGGITDPVIARAPGGHLDKRVPLGHLVAREPRSILLHSATEPTSDAEGRLTGLAGYPVEQRVAALGWVRAHFRVGAVFRYGQDYWYVRLDRRE